MTKGPEELGAKAQIDFPCLDDACGGVVKFSLTDAANPDFQAVCPKCGRAYPLDPALRDKLHRMTELVLALRNVEDIIGDSNVSVNVAGGSVKIPYALLLTRLNTLFTIDFCGRPVDFHLWIEPSSSGMFR